jgi:hypothetical protein
MKKIIPIMIIILILAIGFYNSQKFLPFSSRKTFMPKNELMKTLDKTKDGRIFGLGEANIKTDFATYFGYFDPNHYDPLYNKRYGELIAYANSGKFGNILPRSDVEITNDLQLENNDLEQKRNKLFNLLSVKYLIFKKNDVHDFNVNSIFWQDKNWVIIKNNNSLPHVYFVENFEVIKDGKQILMRMFNSTFDPKNSVILEDVPNFSKKKSNNITNKIKQINYAPNNILLETNVNEDQLLILTDNYYSGWKAYIDGKETRICRANYTFRAIVVPNGIHTIKFSYEPYSVKIGIAISLISLLLYFILYIIYIRRIND